MAFLLVKNCSGFGRNNESDDAVWDDLIEQNPLCAQIRPPKGKPLENFDELESLIQNTAVTNEFIQTAQAMIESLSDEEHSAYSATSDSDVIDAEEECPKEDMDAEEAVEKLIKKEQTSKRNTVPSERPKRSRSKKASQDLENLTNTLKTGLGVRLRYLHEQYNFRHPVAVTRGRMMERFNLLTSNERE